MGDVMGARVVWLCFVLLVGWTAPATAQGSKEAAAAYIAGMEALEAGRYPDAATALSRAVQADSENIEYVRARGVARVLSEDFQNAIADLQRAIALSRERDRESKLWLAAAYSMSGDPMKGSANFTHGGDVQAGCAEPRLQRDGGDLLELGHARRLFSTASRTAKCASNGPVRARFIEAARAYVQRHGATDQASAAARADRLQTSTAQGDWAAAIKDLSALRRASPDDINLRARWATALLRIGNASDARKMMSSGEARRSADHGGCPIALRRARASGRRAPRRRPGRWRRDAAHKHAHLDEARAHQPLTRTWRFCSRSNRHHA